jgi:hypothetical protein
MYQSVGVTEIASPPKADRNDKNREASCSYLILQLRSGHVYQIMPDESGGYDKKSKE